MKVTAANDSAPGLPGVSTQFTVQAPRLAALAFSSPNLIMSTSAAQTVNLTVTLTGQAPAGGMNVPLQSTYSETPTACVGIPSWACGGIAANRMYTSASAIPASLTVAAGSTTATVAISLGPHATEYSGSGTFTVAPSAAANLQEQLVLYQRMIKPTLAYSPSTTITAGQSAQITMTLDTALPVPYTVQVDAFHEFSPYTPEPITVTTTPAVFAANATAAVVTLTSTPVGTGATYYAQFPWDIVPHTEAQMNGSWRLNWAEQQITILHQ